MKFLMVFLLLGAMSVINVVAQIQVRPRKARSASISSKEAYNPRQSFGKGEGGVLTESRFRRDTDLETKVKAYANTDGSRGASVQQDLYKNDNGRVYAHGGIDHQPGFGNQKQAGVAAEFTFGR